MNLGARRTIWHAQIISSILGMTLSAVALFTLLQTKPED